MNASDSETRAGQYRPELPPLPERLWNLPLDDRGYPIPWFVDYVDGKPDFRIVDRKKHNRSIIEDRCWTCGEALGAYKVFAIGPMCVVNRVTSEPPNHRECAEYSVKACPFLNSPKRRRRENDLPEDARSMPGVMLKRNPGVTALWTVKTYGVFQEGDGFLFDVGAPIDVQWWTCGRAATRDEVVASIDMGMSALRELAAAEGPAAIAKLRAMCCDAVNHLPRQMAT